MGVRLRIFLTVVVCVTILTITAGWYSLHNPDRYIPRITAYLQQKTGLQVQIRHIEIHLLPAFLVRIYGLEVKNPKPFPSGDFLNVPQLDATVAKLPLLHGQIAIRSLVLYQPVIDFISDPDGLWNFQNPSGPRKPVGHFSMGVIASLQIKDGALQGSNLIDPADTPGPIVLELGNLSGQLNQIHFHPLANPGSPQRIAGNLTASTARFGSIHTTNLQSQLLITPRQLTFKNFETKTYRGHASGDFSLKFGEKNTAFSTDLRVDGIGMPYLLAEFYQGAPQKHSTSEITGMMQANLNLAGDIAYTSNPLAGIHGTGHITIRKGELPGLDRNKNMIEMERFRTPGTGALPPSAFSTFSGDMELQNHRLYSKQIDVHFYGTNVDGSGSTWLAANGRMDYRAVATVLKKQGFFTNLFARMFKEAHEKNGRLTFPLRITGTLANPKCSIVK